MLADSQLLHKLPQNYVDTFGRSFCIYEDPAYPLRVQLQCSFQNAILPQQRKYFNKSMSQVRIAVE